jgi:PAS domain S-box-containing protein
LDSIADGVFAVDNHWRIMSFNQAAEKITGVPREEAIGQRCCSVFRSSVCESECSLLHTLDTGTPIVNKLIHIITAAGDRLPISISTALLRDSEGNVIGGVETFRDLTVVEELRKELAREYTFSDIISKNHKMREIFRLMPQLAESGSTILFEGESGTGKELFARAIHDLSDRKKGPFVAVNCGALPDTLLESELFGHKAGAFTDARKDRLGRFALAEGGTIFLDEIGDVSSSMQLRLLRVLQERTFEPLGATEPVHADIRVVAATNKALEKLVEEGTFREDLYYRVNVVRVTLPPLRDRKEDIPLLVDHVIQRFNRLRGKDIAGVSDEAMSILMAHRYPGNVRELMNIIEHAFVLCPGGMIETCHLPDHLPPAASCQGSAEGFRRWKRWRDSRLSKP